MNIQLNISDDYFEDEIREGFLVSSRMKKSWAAQMKILSMVAEVFERHEIRWYADYGTLIGAARHKGYIPWDDDLDISVPREDYELMWPYLKKELPEYFHVCAKQTVGGCIAPWGSIRNRRDIDIGGRDPKGAAITATFYDWPFVAGIDVFPLDHIPVDPEEREVQTSIYRSLHEILLNYDELMSEGVLSETAGALGELMGITLPEPQEELKETLWQLDTAVASMFGREESAGMANLYWMIHGTDPIRPYSCFSETVWLPFEMIYIPAPVGYEEILTMEYGNWRVPEKWTQAHGYPYFSEQEERVHIVLEADRLDGEGRTEEEKELLEDGIRKYPTSSAGQSSQHE